MRFLIDTHVFLWWLEDSPKLSPKIRKIFLDPKSQIFVSVVSLWEIIVKKQLGKIDFPRENLSKVIKEEGLLELSLSMRHVELLETLPMIHTDPFDRILLAQNKAEKLTFITHNKILWQYETKIIRA